MTKKATNKAEELLHDITASNKKYETILEKLDDEIAAADLNYAKVMLKKDIDNMKMAKKIIEEEKAKKDSENLTNYDQGKVLCQEIERTRKDLEAEDKKLTLLLDRHKDDVEIFKKVKKDSEQNIARLRKALQAEEKLLNSACIALEDNNYESFKEVKDNLREKLHIIQNKLERINNREGEVKNLIEQSADQAKAVSCKTKKKKNSGFFSRLMARMK